MTTSTLQAAVQTLNQIKARSAALAALLRGVRAVTLATVAISVWALIQPTEELAQLGLGALVLVLALVAGMGRRRPRRISVQDFALALEIQHGPAVTQPLDASRPEAPLPPDWQPVIEREAKDLLAFERRRNRALLSSLILPLTLSFVTLPNAAPSFKLALKEVSSVVGRLARGATLKVVTGGATEEVLAKTFPLSTKSPLELELLSQNLVEISVTGGGFGKAPPVVELYRLVELGEDEPAAAAPKAGASTEQPEKEGPNEAQASPESPAAAKSTRPRALQTFQMLPVREQQAATEPNAPDGEAEATRYSVSFAVSEPVRLFIPAFGGDAPLAVLKVRQLPIPKVKLRALSDLQDPWPDDQPLSLQIDVKAENPLQTVRLLIKSGQRVSKELVANVMAEDKTELSTDYQLVLETYVESDLAQVEIVAEATDRALPTPLVGLSEPLRLNTASAYGRYRETLKTLRELKSMIDETLSSQEEEKLGKEAFELAGKAADQSEKSPFFDGLDRVQIHRFASRLEEYRESGGAEQLLELSQQLNDFLFEHEILDDRERDRDFFVAARSLSRLLEQAPRQRPVELKTVTARLRKFLDDRQERWTLRIERLAPEHRPAAWATVQSQKPFHQMTTTIDRLEEQGPGQPQVKAGQLTALSKSVVDYRSWIEALEAAEDKMRQEEERQRQEGLASARDTLRELQKRQGEVSTDLDRASERPRGQLADQWPATRMKQNANTKETQRLEGQMRSLSPSATARIRAALDAMEATAAAGDGDDFQLAESSSDLAGRLLRQAESATQQSQQQRKSRGRRRRVTGDNYYGQSVVGGDIEIRREYQVDRRYREDILDEAQSTETYDDENRTLLENYLRHVVR